MGLSKKISLYDGNKGDFIRINHLGIVGVMRRRLLDLGFVPGAVVEVLRKSPLGDPIAFRVSQTCIALRKEESQKIEGELVQYE
ncbi:Fe(2+) transport protein A [Peribacillus frigoritolerans]|uniref:FeoA family protein n=1 Tax=Peribacillus frigoritolerans TaxID=450367 RepID=UPI001DE1F158|nr:ferrous iron transport protein A [Peribacillus frigoritolerans]CAH0244775.1 Fe(2+) transport protein A [Peribacillus frigoritolerans]